MLLDILIFSYTIENYNLQQGLQECTPPLLIKGIHAERASLLSTRELHIVHKYSEAVNNVCENVARNSQSLLSDYDRAFIVSFVMQPARQLGIDPAYLLARLPNTHVSSGASEEDVATYQEHFSRLLACRLVSDDIAVTQLGERICERLRLVLGQAIRNFSDKHCKFGMGNVKREVYADAVPRALVHELNSWEASYRRKNRIIRERTQRMIAPTDSEHPRRNSPVIERAKSTRNLYSIYEHEEVPQRPRSSLGIRTSSVPLPDFSQRFKSAELGLDPLSRLSGWKIPAHPETEAFEQHANVV
ncbi:hypothetical protein HRS9122_00892 [Pyrenophora teres f. teres]|nr:hypothetical protein HRS9122_00892 [Pyrenophora teres f. teres]